MIDLKWEIAFIRKLWTQDRYWRGMVKTCCILLFILLFTLALASRARAHENDVWEDAGKFTSFEQKRCMAGITLARGADGAYRGYLLATLPDRDYITTMHWHVTPFSIEAFDCDLLWERLTNNDEEDDKYEY